MNDRLSDAAFKPNAQESPVHAITYFPDRLIHVTHKQLGGRLAAYKLPAFSLASAWHSSLRANEKMNSASA